MPAGLECTPAPPSGPAEIKDWHHHTNQCHLVWCGGLNENDHHQLIRLNGGSPVSGAIWAELGDISWGDFVGGGVSLGVGGFGVS